jgi:hypothetical protein
LTAAGVAVASGENLRAQQKISLQEAKYLDTPREIYMCSICTLFRAARGLQKVVEGPFRPDG